MECNISCIINGCNIKVCLITPIATTNNILFGIIPPRLRKTQTPSHYLQRRKKKTLDLGYGRATIVVFGAKAKKLQFLSFVGYVLNFESVVIN